MNQPPDNWKPVFRSTSDAEVSIVRAYLADNGIESEPLSSHDSVLPVLNDGSETVLYVHRDNEPAARDLIQNHPDIG